MSLDFHRIGADEGVPKLVNHGGDGQWTTGRFTPTGDAFVRFDLDEHVVTNPGIGSGSGYRLNGGYFHRLCPFRIYRPLIGGAHDKHTQYGLAVFGYWDIDFFSPIMTKSRLSYRCSRAVNRS